MYYHINNAKSPWIAAHIYEPSEGNFSYLYPNLKHLIADEFGMLAEFEVKRLIIPKEQGLRHITDMIDRGVYDFNKLIQHYGEVFI